MLASAQGEMGPRADSRNTCIDPYAIPLLDPEMEGEPVFSPKAAMRISAVVGALTAALVSASAALAIPAFPLTLTITGSTTVYPTAHAVLAGPYTAAFPDTNVAGGDVAQPGSGVGIGTILCGGADVATASRPMQASDDTSSTVCAP